MRTRIKQTIEAKWGHVKIIHTGYKFGGVMQIKTLEEIAAHQTKSFDIIEELKQAPTRFIAESPQFLSALLQCESHKELLRSIHESRDDMPAEQFCSKISSVINLPFYITDCSLIEENEITKRLNITYLFKMPSINNRSLIDAVMAHKQLSHPAKNELLTTLFTKGYLYFLNELVANKTTEKLAHDHFDLLYSIYNNKVVIFSPHWTPSNEEYLWQQLINPKDKSAFSHEKILLNMYDQLDSTEIGYDIVLDKIRRFSLLCFNSSANVFELTNVIVKTLENSKSKFADDQIESHAHYIKFCESIFQSVNNKIIAKYILDEIYQFCKKSDSTDSVHKLSEIFNGVRSKYATIYKEPESEYEPASVRFFSRSRAKLASIYPDTPNKTENKPSQPPETDSTIRTSRSQIASAYAEKKDEAEIKPLQPPKTVSTIRTSRSQIASIYAEKTVKKEIKPTQPPETDSTTSTSRFKIQNKKCCIVS